MNEGLGTLEIKPETVRFVVCATSDLIEDASFDVETWLYRKISEGMSALINEALVIGDGVVMVASSNTDAQPRQPYKAHFKSPKSLDGANTQSLMVYVDDAEAHCARAKAAGASIFMELAVHDYGEDHWADRSYGAVDPEGHHWWFTQRMRDPKS